LNHLVYGVKEIRKQVRREKRFGDKEDKLNISG
jgi:hypothetical protein